MNATTRALLVPLLAILAFATAHAAPRIEPSADYGKVVASKAADKSVRIDASTRYVNVADGETVRFEIDQQAFTFAFDTYPGEQSLDL
ncbi:MAG: CzcE family metal-binding protein, partial [Reyranella sp.]